MQPTRRKLLKTGAAAGVAAAAIPRYLFAADAEVELSPEKPGAKISPHIYGHFVEHLGGVIYDGIWVGENSRIPNTGGIRQAFADDMKHIGAPNLRWPGGCFADSYHWRDGIGDPQRRPRSATYWAERLPPELHGVEPNWFGTHEFMRLCRLTGAAPYLAANMTTGSPQEFHDWISYCNAPAGSVSLADERVANGDRDPFQVEYWGVGNEVWGCGGAMRADEYMAVYKRFVNQLPPYGQPYIVGCGPRGHSPGGDLNWTTALFEAMELPRGRVRISGLSMHFYTDFRPTNVSSDQSTAAEWYAVLDAGRKIEPAIVDNWAVMEKYDPRRRIQFVVDEWGVWYARSPELAPGFNLAQVVTLRDAVHTAMHFDIFNRHADKVVMANVAQTTNCLHSLFLSHEDKHVRTPVYHVFDLYKAHMGAQVVPMQVQAGEMTVPILRGDARLPSLSASASVRNDRMTVTLTNPSVDTTQNVKLRITGSRRPAEARASILTHSARNAANTFAQPEQVKPQPLDAAVASGTVTVRLPAKAVAAVDIRLT